MNRAPVDNRARIERPIKFPGLPLSGTNYGISIKSTKLQQLPSPNLKANDPGTGLINNFVRRASFELSILIAKKHV